MTHSEEAPPPELIETDARLSFTVTVSHLKAMTGLLSGLVPLKDVIPGTSNLSLEAVAPSERTLGYLEGVATDGEVSMLLSPETDIQVQVPGKALFPAKKLHAILGVLPDSTRVSISVIAYEAKIRAGRSQWKLQLEVRDSLPVIAEDENSKSTSVPAEDFISAIERVKYAMSTSLARPSLMQIAIRDGAIIASDGGRIHRVTFPAFDSEFTIPHRAVTELLKLYKKYDDTYEIKVSYSDRVVKLQVGDNAISSTRLLVDFPDVNALLLGTGLKNTDVLSVDQKEISEAITRVRVNADQEKSCIFLRPVPVKVVNGGTLYKLGVRAIDTYGNSAQSVIPCSWTGKKNVQELCVNYRYLEELIKATQTETLSISLGEDSKTVRNPILIVDDDFQGSIVQMTPEML